MTLISVLSISENQAKIYVKRLLQEVSGSGINCGGKWMDDVSGWDPPPNLWRREEITGR